MKIHEYQAKSILSRYGVTTPRGEVVFTKDEAREAAHRLRSNVTVVVVKAQIHAGGRGKAGGVKLARSSDEAADIASHILGMKLVTLQTGPAGRIVKRLLIEEGLDIKRELYLGLLVDRATGLVVFMASAAGGMEIEEVAKNNPGAICANTFILPSACSRIKPAKSPSASACRAKSRILQSHFSRLSIALSLTPTPHCSKSILACSPVTANL